MTHLPNDMAALVYTGPNALDVTRAPLPVPGPDEALVRVRAVGICGSDMHAYHGHDSRRPAPLILGHEAAGEVVGGPRHGARVTINPLVIPAGDAAAAAGRPHLSAARQILSMPPRPGAFAEYVAAPLANLLDVPDDFPLAKAALAEPMAVSWHAVRIGIERLFGAPFATALVLGGGAIGVGAALVARHMGAGAVWLAETNAARRDRLSGLEGISVCTPEVAAQSCDGCDLVIDAVGAVATRAAASALVRPGGVIVHVGLLPGEAGFDIRRITLQEITLTGSYCYTPQDFADCFSSMVSGALGPLDWAETRALSGGPAAFADLDGGRVAAPKVILQP